MDETKDTPYQDIDIKALEADIEERFGEKDLRSVKELQVGFGARVLRSNESGLWLGAKTFATAPFSVDMDGNVIVKSLKTNATGQHIEIDSANTNQIRFYDGTTLFGLLEVDYDAGLDQGFINLLAQDSGSGIRIDVGVGASDFSSVEVFSSGGGFSTSGNASSGFNYILGKTSTTGDMYFGVNTVGGVDYLQTDLLPSSDPGIPGVFYEDGTGVVMVSL